MKSMTPLPLRGVGTIYRVALDPKIEGRNTASFIPNNQGQYTLDGIELSNRGTYDRGADHMKPTHAVAQVLFETASEVIDI